MNAQFTWDGGDSSSRDWSDDNWTGTAPTTGFSNDFVFGGNTNTGTLAMPLNNDLTGGTVTSITFDSGAGAFVIGGEAFTLDGNIAFTGNPSSPVTHVIENDITLSSGTKIITLEDNGKLTLNGEISGGQPVVVNGDGTLTLNNSTNSFTRLQVSGNATVIIDHFGALGSENRILAGSGNNTPTLEYTGEAVATDVQLRWGLTSGTGGLIFRNTSSTGGTVDFTNSILNLRPPTYNGTGDTRNIELDANTGDIIVRGLIQDPENTGIDITSLTKTGSHSLTLEGINTYTGSTTVSEGTLILNANQTLNSTSGITIASNATLQQTGIAGGMINDAALVTVNGRYDLDKAEQIGNLAGSGIVSATDLNSSGANEFVLSVGVDNTNSTFSGQLTESINQLALTKRGTGILTLSNAGASASDYTGQTFIAEGTLQLGSNGGLGNTGSVKITDGTLDLNNFDQTIGNELTFGGGLNASGVINTGTGTLTMRSSSGRLDIDYLSANAPLGAVINGFLELDPANKNVIFEVQDSTATTEELTINAIISNGNNSSNIDGGTFYITSGGTMILNGVNTFDMAALQVRGGTWVLGTDDFSDGVSAGALGKNDEIVSIGNNAENENAALLLKSGVTSDRDVTVINDSTVAVTRTLGGFDNSGTSTFSGDITMNNGTIGSTRLTADTGSTVVFSGVISNGANPVGIEKIGGGTVRLEGNNTFEGDVLISEGTLALSSTTLNTTIGNTSLIEISDSTTLDVSGITTSGGFELQNGQTLAGQGSATTGNISGNTTLLSGSTLTAGENGTIGTLAFGNDLTTETGSTWLVDLVNDSSSADLVNITGALTLGGALSINEVSGSFTEGASYTIANYGSRSGTFSNAADGAIITSGGGSWRVNYGGTGAGAITLTAVPEPATFIPLLLLLAGGIHLTRKRQKRNCSV
ncbi:MAG: autotransporter-associated beta strand repeat-containing protein [Verrucomicrobiales bacterium]|nr:autotransporter-associated beta strand repeat-containing protein [Verrucomicrobiales bacterium]